LKPGAFELWVNCMQLVLVQPHRAVHTVRARNLVLELERHAVM
jgi:hypothetical protein